MERFSSFLGAAGLVLVALGVLMMPGIGLAQQEDVNEQTTCYFIEGSPTGQCCCYYNNDPSTQECTPIDSANTCNNGNFLIIAPTQPPNNPACASCVGTCFQSPAPPKGCMGQGFTCLGLAATGCPLTCACNTRALWVYEGEPPRYEFVGDYCTCLD